MSKCLRGYHTPVDVWHASGIWLWICSFCSSFYPTFLAFILPCSKVVLSFLYFEYFMILTLGLFSEISMTQCLTNIWSFCWFWMVNIYQKFRFKNVNAGISVPVLTGGRIMNIWDSNSEFLLQRCRIDRVFHLPLLGCFYAWCLSSVGFRFLISRYL